MLYRNARDSKILEKEGIFLTFLAKFGLMEPIDAPISLHFKNGRVFPPNSLFMGYTILAIAIFVSMALDIYFGLAGILIGSFIAFTRYGVIILDDGSALIEYTRYFGFIQIAKKKSLNAYSFVTVIPVKQTSTIYSRSSSSTSITDYFQTISLLKSNYRGKLELTRLNSKSIAEETARKLAERLNLHYFDYDPQLIREKLLSGKY